MPIRGSSNGASLHSSTGLLRWSSSSGTGGRHQSVRAVHATFPSSLAKAADFVNLLIKHCPKAILREPSDKTNWFNGSAHWT
jgi:hypothetical protein